MLKIFKNNKQGHNSIDIANIFVQKAMENNEKLSLATLLKYVYLAHGFTLGNTGKPLVSHDFHAWPFGPVVSEVYDAFSNQAYIITHTVKRSNFSLIKKSVLSNTEQKIIDLVYDEYSKKTEIHITKFLKNKQGPWGQYKHVKYNLIPNKAIMEYFANLVKDNNKTKKQPIERDII